jgi:outer membrane protein assembly factor BamB
MTKQEFMPMNKPLCMSAVLILCLGTIAVGAADNWPSWRGPAFNGVCDAVNVPTAWSATDNVAWKLPLPGPSGSTPAVWDDRVFVTTTGEGKNLVLCIDRSGKILWQKAVGDERKGKHDRKGSGAHPSPTTDGTHVFVYYRSGDLACLDFQGNIVWQKNLQQLYGPDTLWWDLGTSPVLTRDHVVVAVIHDKPAFLLAFDKATGQLAWKQDRSLDAPREANQSYTTPIVYTESDRQTLFILGADHITAHNAADGKEIWRVGGLNPDGQGFFRCIASPVVSDGILVAPYARGKTLTAVRLGGSGDVTKTHQAWFRDDLSTDIPSLAAKDGRLYVLADRGQFACMDIKTGKTLWSGELANRKATFSASPVLVDGKIYLTSDSGTTFVLQQGDEFKLLATNELGEFTMATPVFTRNQILIKTYKNLFCIGK